MKQQGIDNHSDFDKVGIVGLGLMGSSIVTAMLLVGYKVVAVAPIPDDIKNGPQRIRRALEVCEQQGVLSLSISDYLAKIKLTENYNDLTPCKLVMECVIEDIEIKKNVYSEIERHITPETILTTNTSAIPISLLQCHMTHPARFLGMHWSEPAFTSRFLEIVCGDQTDIGIAEHLHQVARHWGKEPTLVRKDILGFITNRIMYAMYREAFYLVENGYATIDDVDRACRNDGGHWMTFCGLFRYMDITGFTGYYNVMKTMFPTLSNQTNVPTMMEEIIRSGGKGLTNGKGFYTYTKEEAGEWERAFEEFSFDISRVSEKYYQRIYKDRSIPVI